ncbi:DUF2155 domain-containing protein [Paracoccus sp. S-4012]|uniref:DUF2155 domain-containing protein n=1 Tax=Paracoccus sp. S-4012 TaxID=2665648 RepID=UPI0012B06FC0|nr:DUF2155 domain-containing protein [Paracoccus sp. S-4012]MRX49527.1 DUF2155 domain-containing protein [Paracoccus sp. S-4012]
MTPGSRNSLAAVCLLLLATPALAQPQPRPDRHGGGSAEAAAAAAARGTVAVLRGLDKIKGTTTDLTLETGEAVRFGRLEVRLGECRYPVDDPGSDAFAALTITDTVARHTVFSGWMIASSPAISALDDARYDIWVVSCSNAAASGSGPESEAGTDNAEDSAAR